MHLYVFDDSAFQCLLGYIYVVISPMYANSIVGTYRCIRVEFYFLVFGHTSLKLRQVAFNDSQLIR